MHQSMPCSVASAAMQTDCTSTNVRPGDITFNYTNPHLGIQSLDLLSGGCQLRRPVQKMRQSECLQRHSRWALHQKLYFDICQPSPCQLQVLLHSTAQQQLG